MRNIAGLFVLSMVLSHVAWALIVDAVQRWIYDAGGVYVDGIACFEKDSE